MHTTHSREVGMNADCTAVRQMENTSILYRVGAPLDAVLRRCPVAVAGTREPTQWGRRMARELGRRLAEEGCAVVTGLARGIDEEAVAGALEAGGCVVGVLPYLLERDGGLNPRAVWLLRMATLHDALASVVAENPVKDDGCIRAWLAMRNRVIARMASALVVPEARFKPARWGTRYAVEHALTAGRLVLMFKPLAKSDDMIKAYVYFRQRGAVVVADVDDVIDIVERQCRRRRKTV